MDYGICKAESQNDLLYIELTDIIARFIKNSLFYSNLQEYILTEYDVDCRIPTEFPIDDDYEVKLEFVGIKTAVQLAHDRIKEIFQTMKTKIYNNENTDKKMIHWSKNIYSDSALDVIQRICDNRNVFTIWEKTDILSGYYIVHYFNSDHKFNVSEKDIDSIVNNDILYVQDIIIHNIDSIQTNFRKELDEFIDKRKQEQQQLQTFAIIYYEYSSQTELKLSFFGEKRLVNNARKQLLFLINKHEIKMINIELDSTQREHLLENCIYQLKNIELEYTDDNVKIKIRENVFYAPHYLISTIKQFINTLVFETSTIIFQYIKGTLLVTAGDQMELKRIAQNYNCQIDQIDIRDTNEIIRLPKTKTISTIHSTSSFLIQESNHFITGLKLLTRLSTSTGGIEIHKMQDSITDTIDITIISKLTENSYNQIEFNVDHLYVESSSHRNTLFIPWIPPSIELDNIQAETTLEASINEFISITLTQITNQYMMNIKRIAFSTKEWEYYSNKKLLAEKLIYALKSQLEEDKFSSHDWIVLFVFDDNQSDTYNIFTQVIQSIQTETNDYEQFYYPMSTMTIVLKASRNHNISKCQNAIEEYVQKHIITKIELNNPFNSEIWNQFVINVYYKYCIEQSVFPKFYHINQSNGQPKHRLDLIGLASTVYKMRDWYELMQNIIQQKTLVSMEKDKNIEVSKSHQFPQFTIDVLPNLYNILILSCSRNDILSRRLTTRLIDEGYLVHTNLSNQLDSNFTSQIEKTDLILVCFSRHCSEDENYLAQIKLAKLSGKKMISVLSLSKVIEQDTHWLDSVTETELYYELFREEIHFIFNEDFDFEYDRLLFELLQYTKPGFVGRIYSPLTIDSKKEEQSPTIENLQIQITIEERRQKEEIYERTVEKIKEQDTIPIDEVTKLIESLTSVMEICKHDQLLDIQGEKATTNNNLNNLYLCIKRWIEKASNGIITKSNMPPFSLTGDFNDAPYPILLENKAPWWAANEEYSDFEYSPPAIYFHNPALFIGSWFNKNESNCFYHILIDKDNSLREERRRQRRAQKNIEQNKKYNQPMKSKDESRRKISKVVHDSKFTTELKEDHTAWDITEDVLIIKEYEKKQNKAKVRKNREGYTAWERLVERSIKLLSDIKDGTIDLDSDILQGKIGKESKTEEELQQLYKLDNPNNKCWSNKQPRRCTREFLQVKIQNTIEWKKLSEISENM